MVGTNRSDRGLLKKKTAVCIFAHPDDEAFGPSGTIYKLSKKYDVYLLCATRGEVGQNNSSSSSKSKKSLSDIRSEELKESAEILGVKKVYFLGFVDGTLSNALYHKLLSEIEKYLRRLRPEVILTQDHKGVSGHIDHIVVSMVSSFAFDRNKFVKKIMYACPSKQATDAWEKYPYFIYRPEGYEMLEIDEVVDVSDVWDVKLAAGAAHKSQIDDFNRILDVRRDLPKEEYFLTRKR